MASIPNATSMPSAAQPSTTPRPVPGAGPVSFRQQTLDQYFSASQYSPASSDPSVQEESSTKPNEEESSTQRISTTRLKQVWKRVKPFVSIFGKVTTWLWGFLALLALVFTIWAYQLALWTADKEFRDACLAEQQRENLLSNECTRAIRQELRAPPLSKWHIADRDIGDGAADLYNWLREVWSICLGRKGPNMLLAYTHVLLVAVDLLTGPRMSHSKPGDPSEGHQLSVVTPPGLAKASLSLSGLFYILATIGVHFAEGPYWYDPLNGSLALIGIPIAIITLWCTPRPRRIHPLLAWPVRLLALSLIFAAACLIVYGIDIALLYILQAEHPLGSGPKFVIYLLVYMGSSWYVMKGLRIPLDMLSDW